MNPLHRGKWRGLGVTTSMTCNGPEFPEEGLKHIRGRVISWCLVLE